MKAYFFKLMSFAVTFFVCAVCYGQSTVGVSITTTDTSQPDEVLVSVQPIKNATDKPNKGYFITGQIIRGLSKSDFIKVMPLNEMVQNIWKYSPDGFAIKPAQAPVSPESVEMFGTLTVEQKKEYSIKTGCQYLIDGSFIKDDNDSRIAIDLYYLPQNRIVCSFSATTTSDSTIYDVTETLTSKVLAFIFENIADNLVIKLMRDKTAGKISSIESARTLSRYETLYGDNLFINAGRLLLFSSDNRGIDDIKTAGREWFKQKDKNLDKQIRFFESFNANPYLIYGRSYMANGDYQNAIKILSVGNDTFPFNTDELKDELIMCYKLSGLSDKAESLKKERKK